MVETTLFSPWYFVTAGGYEGFIEIKNNRTLTVKEGYEKIFIDKGDRERTVSKGHDYLLVSTGDHKVTVDEPASLGGDEGEMRLSGPVEAALDGAVELVEGLIRQLLASLPAGLSKEVG